MKETLEEAQKQQFNYDNLHDAKEISSRIKVVETLEEVAERLYPIILEDDGWDKNKQYRDEWIDGAKWQQERSYSEEEVLDIIQLFNDDFNMIHDTIPKWFEQFKKK